MANLITQPSRLLNPLLFSKYDYRAGISASVAQPKTLEEFIISEEQSLRAPSTYQVSFNRIVRISTTHNTTNITGDYFSKWVGLVVVDKVSGLDLALLAIEPMIETITSANTVDTLFNLNIRVVT